MAYVSVTGGQEAIAASATLSQAYRYRNPEIVLDAEAIQYRLRLLVDRVMSEGGMYGPEYAALALKQAEGEPSEAAFLLRAYRSALPRLAYSLTANMTDMRLLRRISSAFRDIPGGQMLGPTYDYAHRLLNFQLSAEGIEDQQAFLQAFLASCDIEPGGCDTLTLGKVTDWLRGEGLLAEWESNADEQPFDITRQKLTFPAPRSARLQTLARGETGAMTALAFGSMRGHGVVHPTIGEMRVGFVPVYVPYPYGQEKDNPDEAVYIGEVLVTEVETINSFIRDKASGNVRFLLGYGLCYGQNELKAIAMAILERSLETEGTLPTQDEEFVLLHIDGVDAAGFVGHLKLPHYVTFQSSLDRIRRVSGEPQEQQSGGIAAQKEGQSHDKEHAKPF